MQMVLKLFICFYILTATTSSGIDTRVLAHSFCEEYSKSPEVFLGTLVERKVINSDIRYTFRVIEIYKGSPDKFLIAWSLVKEASYGFIGPVLDEGQDYIVYISKYKYPKRRILISNGNRSTKPVAGRDNEIKVLRAYKGKNRIPPEVCSSSLK